MFLALLTAGALWAAFPPLNCWPLAWVALVPLLILLERVTSRRAAFGWSYAAGFGFFFLTLLWIRFVTFPGLLLMSAYLALYFGVFGLLFRGISLSLPDPRRRLSLLAVLSACAWGVLEYIRSIALTGFGWGALGTSQADFKNLLPLASVTGVAGLSFLVVTGNVIFKELFAAKWKEPALLAVFLVLLWAGGFLPTWDIQSASAKRIAIIQPNTALEEAWEPESKDNVIHRVLTLSRQSLAQKPVMIVWPESAFPNFTWDRPDLLDEVKAFARDHKIYLLFGATTREGDRFYNSAVLIGPSGHIVGTRSKRHLVPFGEYIPYRKEFPFLEKIIPIDDFTPGGEEAIFEVPQLGKFGVLICFEDTLPEISRRLTARGAGFLVNLTNDAWFRDSGQPAMHLRNALFRAVENARPLIRATNTGESCAIGSDGREKACVENSEGRRVQINGFVVVSIYSEALMTQYTQWGEWFAAGCALVLLGYLLVRLSRRNMAPPRVKKVLLIDDEKTAHVLLKAVLGSRGFEVLSAMSGEEGLALAVSAKPDLILLDVIMPTLKGRDVCKQLKVNSETARIPIVFLTAKDSEDDLKAEQALGAVGHVTKPVNSALLIKTINKIIGA